MNDKIGTMLEMFTAQKAVNISNKAMSNLVVVRTKYTT